MPSNKRLCSFPGCGQRLPCTRHIPKRATAAQRGYGHDHATLFRNEVLRKDPTCVVCREEPATVADHYPRTRKQLVIAGLNPNNPLYGRGLCEGCHGRETARRQPGGYITPR